MVYIDPSWGNNSGWTPSTSGYSPQSTDPNSPYYVPPQGPTSSQIPYYTPGVPSANPNSTYANSTPPSDFAGYGADGQPMYFSQSGGSGMTYVPGKGYINTSSHNVYPSTVQSAAPASSGSGSGGAAAPDFPKDQYNPLTDGAHPGTGDWSASQPYITKDYAPMEAQLRNILTQRFSQNNLPPEYAAQGMENINSTYAGTNQSLENKMATAGLYGSPMQGAAMGASESGRAGELAGFQNQLPLLQRSLQDQDMQTAASLISAFGRGQGGFSQGMQLSGQVDPVTGMPYTTTTGGGGGSTAVNPYTNQVIPSYGVGNALGSAGSILASLYGMGAFGGGSSSSSRSSSGSSGGFSGIG